MPKIPYIDKVIRWYRIFEFHSFSILIYSLVIIFSATGALTYNKGLSDENVKLRKENSVMSKELETLQEKYLIEYGKNILISSQLYPFKKLSGELYPELEINSGLKKLHIELLKSKFIPLRKTVVEEITEKLKIIKDDIHEEELLFKITFEPSAEPGLRRFAEQVKVIFNSVGMEAVVETNNVYLFDLPIPVEWGGNAKNDAIVSKIISAFRPAFVDVSNHKKRITSRFPRNFIRMHIAGRMQFESSGIVKVE